MQRKNQQFYGQQIKEVRRPDQKDLRSLNKRGSNHSVVDDKSSSRIADE